MMSTSAVILNVTGNATIEHETIAESSTYILPFTKDWVIASTVVLSVFFVFGVTANSITIAVIRKSRKLRNRYYAILCSLCVSDIISAFISVLFVYRRTWGFLYFAWPEFFCRFYWAMDLWTSFSTAFHILSFAILRLIGVRWPTKFKRISTRHMTPFLAKHRQDGEMINSAKLMANVFDTVIVQNLLAPFCCVLGKDTLRRFPQLIGLSTQLKISLWISGIWIITFCFGFIPHFIFNTVKVIDRENQPEQARWASCSLAEEWIPTWQIYVQFAYSIFLYIPALSIIGISVSIAMILKKHVPPGMQNSTPFTSVSATIENQNVKTTGGSAIGSSSRPNSSTGQNSNTSTPVLKSKERLVVNRQIAFQRRWKKERRAIVQLFLIVGSFFLGYIPFSAFHFYTGFTLSYSDSITNAIDWRFAMIQYILLRFSECLNPVFYNLASKKMREETKSMLKKAFRISSKQRRAGKITLRQAKFSSDV